MKIKFFILFIFFIKITKIGKTINKLFDFIVYMINYEFLSFKALIKKKSPYDRSYEFVKKHKIILNKKNNNKINFNKKVIYLFNHRTWADMFIDYYISKGCFISRKIMKYFVPFTYKLSKSDKISILFERGNTKDKNVLYKKIKEKLKEKSLIVYPEGTRNTSNKSKPLKFGIIKLGYQENVPFQICIVSNKEKVLNEKKLSIGKNINCEYYVSEIIHPKDYKTLEEFIDVIQKKWDESWNVIYNNV